MSFLPHALPKTLSRSLGESVARTGLSPNALTALGLLGSAGAASFAAYGHFWQAGLLLLVAGALDLLDGGGAGRGPRAG